ncbi:IS66-like element accessory protein TnpA [Phenylobacterium sp.]|uniref:IS66-like element accessory protein TnpA n=1 Tax=Phenylobacterium sp. TaxID=1871053 RepID=UPI002F420BF8
MSVITGPVRYRRWRPEDKLAILAEAFAPGATVSDVSRRLDVATSLIYKWRRQAMAPPADPGFVPATLTDERDQSARASSAAVIVVDLAGGGRVGITASAPASLVTATLRALR